MLGDLVVNLVANTAGFASGMRLASGSISKFAASLTGVLGAGVSIAAFREQEQAVKKLNSVLASTGGAAGLTSDEIVGLAGDLQKVTNFADETTISAAGVLATFTKIKGDTFKQALMSAQDLSAVMGQDLQSSVVQIGKALNDPLKGMTALQRVGVSFTETQKQTIKNMMAQGNLAGAQAIILKELQTEFGGAAQAMADPLIIFKNQVGEIAEGIGSLILPSLQLIATTITGGMLAGSEGVAATFAAWGQTLTGVVQSGLNLARQGIVAIGFGIENIGPLWELAWKTAALGAVVLTNEVMHFFTGVLPALFDWFTSNWSDIWFTAVDTVLTVLINIGQNVRNLFSEVWDFIASGGQDAFEFTFEPLLKGAQNTIRELPKIPERAIGEMEAGLASDVESLGNKLGEDLGATMALAIPDAAATATLPVRKPGADIEAGGSKGEVKGAGAALLGSKEALSSIFHSMRGDKVQDRIAKAAEQQAANQERTNELLEDMAEDVEVVSL